MDGKDTTSSWIILALVTFIEFLETGIIKGLSVLLPEIKEQLGTKTWIVGSCISVVIGWGYILGLSANALVNRFGARFCLMICGLISSVGLIICSCATTVGVLLFGLLLVGFSLLQENIADGIIPKYFDKYYSTAVSIYSCGLGLGIVIIPPFIQLLLDAFGWRGVLVLLSGLNLHSILCGALFKHRQTLKTNGHNGRENSPLLSSSISSPAHTASDGKCLVELRQTMAKLFKKSSLTTLPFITCALLPCFVFGYTLTGWMIYIVSFALSNGASISESSTVAMYGGVGILSIRITLPFLHKLVQNKILTYTSSFIMVISLIVTMFMSSLIGMSLSSVMFGIGVGMLGTEIYIATKDVVDEVDYMNAIGCLHFTFGFASILSGTITGYIFDVSGSFNFSFAILSAVSLIAPISVAVEGIRTSINKE